MEKCCAFAAFTFLGLCRAYLRSDYFIVYREEENITSLGLNSPVRKFLQGVWKKLPAKFKVKDGKGGKCVGALVLKSRTKNVLVLGCSGIGGQQDQFGKVVKGLLETQNQLAGDMDRCVIKVAIFDKTSRLVRSKMDTLFAVQQLTGTEISLQEMSLKRYFWELEEDPSTILSEVCDVESQLDVFQKEMQALDVENINIDSKLTKAIGADVMTRIVIDFLLNEPMPHVESVDSMHLKNLAMGAAGPNATKHEKQALFAKYTEMGFQDIDQARDRQLVSYRDMTNARNDLCSGFATGDMSEDEVATSLKTLYNDLYPSCTYSLRFFRRFSTCSEFAVLEYCEKNMCILLQELGGRLKKVEWFPTEMSCNEDQPQKRPICEHCKLLGRFSKGLRTIVSLEDHCCYKSSDMR